VAGGRTVWLIADKTWLMSNIGAIGNREIAAGGIYNAQIILR